MLNQRRSEIPTVPFSNIRRRFEKPIDHETIQNLNEKLDKVLMMVQDLKKDVSLVKKQLDNQERRVMNSSKNENIEKKFNEISAKLIELENNIEAENNGNFSPQMINDAREQLNLDLRTSLVFKKKIFLILYFFL